jgi:hypothetical protein
MCALEIGFHARLLENSLTRIVISDPESGFCSKFDAETKQVSPTQLDFSQFHSRTSRGGEAPVFGRIFACKLLIEREILVASAISRWF